MQRSLLQPYDLNKYGRILADLLLLDVTCVNHKLVKEGWCWWYRKYALRDTVLEQIEAERQERQSVACGPSAPFADVGVAEGETIIHEVTRCPSNDRACEVRTPISQVLQTFLAGYASREKHDQEFSCCIRLIEQ